MAERTLTPVTSADDYLLQLLRRRGLLPAHVAEGRASPAPAERHRSLAEQLVAEGAVTPELLADTLAQELGLTVAPPARLSPPAEIVALVPADVARQARVLPVELRGRTLRVATEDPLHIEVIDALAQRLGRPVEVLVAPVGSLAPAIARAYAATATPATDAPPASPLANPAGRATPVPETREAAADAPAVQWVQRAIADAVRRGASDLHWEPLGRRFRLRYRIDGTMVEADSPTRSLQPAILTRLKLMANLSIAEKRLPQDGRARVHLDGRALDLRVSALPTLHGESVVMRVLDQSGLRLGLPQLGLAPPLERRLRALLEAPDGMILVTGPTGSGKTTTLYSCLQHLNRPDRKLITVEDPVEYQLAGINQVPVRPEVGMSFGSALRAMLRQAPNVIMIGEIRDAETAEIAIHAALTGHLVFSSLHTNDAVGAVTRLVDLGLKPYQVAGAVRAVLAQRLVRRTCPACGPASGRSPAAQPVPASASCPVCEGTGFRGRIGIFELFEVDEELQQLIHQRAPESLLRRTARARGLLTMREDGRRQVRAGLTTDAEVLAATVDEQTS